MTERLRNTRPYQEAGIGFNYTNGNGVQKKERAHPVDLDEIRTNLSLESAKRQERLRERSLDDYLSETFTTKEGEPKRAEYASAAGMIKKAILAKEVILHSSGQNEYTFFTGRTDEHQYIGNLPVLEEVVDFLTAHEKGTTARDQIMLFVGPSGSGKSVIADALKAGYEEYSQDTDIDPIYAIADCPVNENPLHILKNQLSETLPSEACLCPDCKKRLDHDFKSDPQKFKVRALDISSSQGIGITKLEDHMTSSFTVNTLIRASNRGILEITEYSRHNASFRQHLAELMTSHTLQVLGVNEETNELQRKEYQMDHVVIATTTLTEWEAERKRLEKDFPGELRRIKEIKVPFVTSLDDEVDIYKKAISRSATQPHISPQSLELLAEVALRTRYKDVQYEKGGKTITVDADKKLQLYNGEDTPELKQKERKKIEALSRDKDEGMNGLSPTFMMGVLGQAITKEQECINAVELLKTCKEVINNTAKLPTGVDKKTVDGFIDRAKEKFDVHLVKDIKNAFRGDHEEALHHNFNYYLEQAEYSVTGKTFTNQTTGEEEHADETFLSAIEANLPEPIMAANKREFRNNILTQYAFAYRKRKDVTYKDLPDLHAAIERQVIGISDADIEEILLSQRTKPDPLQEQKLQEVMNRLVEAHGYCACCAPDMMRYCADIIYHRDSKKV